MKRRQALKNAALLFGGVFSASTLKAYDILHSSARKTSTFTLTAVETNLVAEVAEIILPRTNTPGAKDAGVPDFIVMMIQDCYRAPDQLSFKEGLEALQNANFANLSASQRTDYLKKLEQDTKELMKAYYQKQGKMGDNLDITISKEQPKGLPFWRLIKELTLLGYYTSEKGIMANYNYVPVPGKFEIIKIKPNQKVFAY